MKALRGFEELVSEPLLPLTIVQKPVPEVAVFAASETFVVPHVNMLV